MTDTWCRFSVELEGLSAPSKKVNSGKVSRLSQTLDTDRAYIPKSNKIEMQQESRECRKNEGFVIYSSVKTDALIFGKKG